MLLLLCSALVRAVLIVIAVQANDLLQLSLLQRFLEDFVDATQTIKVTMQLFVQERRNNDELWLNHDYARLTEIKVVYLLSDELNHLETSVDRHLYV
jgi:hypothetical protein